MKKNIQFSFLFIIMFIFSSFSLASRKTDHQYKQTIDNERISFVPLKGFHFNDKAPASIQFDASTTKEKPQIKTEQKIQFKKSPIHQKAKVSFYLCDDAKTVCEAHNFEVQLTQKKSENSDLTAAQLKSQPDSQVNTNINSSPLSQKNEKSDSENNQKFQVKRDTLYIFSAPWCPGCIRLKTETLSQSDLKTTLKKFDVKSINVDLQDNRELSDYYKVNVIPTIVYVNKKSQEVLRITDFIETSALKSELQAALKSKLSLSEVEAKAHLGDISAKKQMFDYSIASFNYEEAIKWFDTNFDEHRTNKYINAKAQLESDKEKTKPEDKINYISTLNTLIASSTSLLDQAVWSVEKIEFATQEKIQLKQDEIDQIKNKINILLAKSELELKEIFKNSSQGDSSQFEKIQVFYMNYQVALALNKTSDIETSKALLQNELTKFKVNYAKPGQLLSYIYYNSKLKNDELVKQVYEELIKKYNTTYVYYEKYANYLNKNENFQKAAEQAELAIKYAEGNLPKLKYLKAQVLVKLKQKEAAQQLLNEIKEEIKDNKNSKNLLKRVEQLLKDIQ